MAKDPAGTDSQPTAEELKAAEAKKVEAEKAAEAKKAEAEQAALKPVEMTAADAAALVTRTVVVPAKKEGGKPTTEQVAVAAAEVLSFKEYDNHVVVVTTDGQKLTGNK